MIAHEMDSRVALCPWPRGLDRAVYFEPVSGRIGESRRGAHGPECARVSLADARLVCRSCPASWRSSAAPSLWACGASGSRRRRARNRGGAGCLAWPIAASDESPAIVVGETHHPVEAREISHPDWLVIPERGLYTGVAIFGAVGSGKTSACMHPFARQLLGWQAGDPERRAAALILEVKGDFCHDIREILKDAGREDDYLELGLDGAYQWNPLGAHWLDSYSLAYTVSSLLNQLFGKGKDPFWQQAYTNLVKWIIELHRIFPDRWVTLQDVYRCAINPELFKQKIGEAELVVESQQKGAIVIEAADFSKHKAVLGERPWAQTFRPGMPNPVGGRCRTVVASQRCPLRGWRPCGPHRHRAFEGTARQRENLVRARLDATRSEAPDLVRRRDFEFPVPVRHGGHRLHFLSQGAPAGRELAPARTPGTGTDVRPWRRPGCADTFRRWTS